MVESDILGNKLFMLRKKSGQSQEELAEKLGVSRQAVSKWECGESFPDTEKLIAISKLYGVSLDELVGNPLLEKERKAAAITDTLCKKTEENSISCEDEAVEKETKNSPALRLAQVLPYPVLVIGMFLIWGFVWSGWGVAWTLFLTIPIYYSILECVKVKKLSPFAYPVLVAFVYLFIGMKWGLWHPYWILFITIPVYYAIAEAIDGKEK